MGRAICKILIPILCCLLASCVKDKPRGQQSYSSAGNVYVVCEGNFGNGNASLYSINTANDSVYGDLYKAANNQSLGDVFQSIKKIGDKLFLCINNSDKIVIINASNLKVAGTIGIPKPRYILPVSSTTAYVSSLYNNKLYIIDLASLSIKDSITLPGFNTEGMCTWNGSIMACTWDTAINSIYRIDPATNKVVQTIPLGGYAPQAALVDREQMLWVLSGNKTKGRPAALTRIDPSTGQALMTLHFPTNADPLKPIWNNTRDTLYFIEVDYNGATANNGIYRMDIHDAALPQQPFITAAQYQYYWALGIDPHTGNIFVGDPRGFTQKGSVSIYTPSGIRDTTLSVGLGPGAFYFED